MLTKDQKEELDIPSGGDFSPVPMDSYTCQIADVNMVSQFNKWRGEEENVLNFLFIILDDKKMPKDGSTRGRYLWKRCRLSLNNKSWLYKLAKAAIGRDLTKEEMDSFDPEAMVNEQVNVMVEQNESKDKQRIFNNIVAFNKTAKKLEAVEYDPEAQGSKVVEKETTPAEAPKKSDEEVENFTKGLEDEAADAPAEAGEEKSVEQLEKELAAAKAKAKK